MRNTILVFAGLTTALLTLFRVGRYSVFSGDLSTEILLAVTALAFLGVGLLLRNQLPKSPPTAERDAGPEPARLKELSIFTREMEVLELAASCSFGQPSFGLTTGNGNFYLPDSSYLFLTSTVMADRTGKVYGDKVIPDSVIEESQNETDETLAAALAWLESQ